MHKISFDNVFASACLSLWVGGWSAASPLGHKCKCVSIVVCEMYAKAGQETKTTIIVHSSAI